MTRSRPCTHRYDRRTTMERWGKEERPVACAAGLRQHPQTGCHGMMPKDSDQVSDFRSWNRARALTSTPTWRLGWDAAAVAAAMIVPRSLGRKFFLLAVPLSQGCGASCRGSQARGRGPGHSHRSCGNDSRRSSPVSLHCGRMVLFLVVNRFLEWIGLKQRLHRATQSPPRCSWSGCLLSTYHACWGSSSSRQ